MAPSTAQSSAPPSMKVWLWTGCRARRWFLDPTTPDVEKLYQLHQTIRDRLRRGVAGKCLEQTERLLGRHAVVQHALLHIAEDIQSLLQARRRSVGPDSPVPNVLSHVTIVFLDRLPHSFPDTLVLLHRSHRPNPALCIAERIKPFLRPRPLARGTIWRTSSAVRRSANRPIAARMRSRVIWSPAQARILRTFFSEVPKTRASPRTPPAPKLGPVSLGAWENRRRFSVLIDRLYRPLAPAEPEPSAP